MRKLVAHFNDPAPLPSWAEQLPAIGFRRVDDNRWQQQEFLLTLQIEGDLWLHGEGQGLAPGAVSALLDLAARLASGGELELFEEDGRLLQRHSF